MRPDRHSGKFHELARRWWGMGLNRSGRLRCVMAQLNMIVGDVEGNTSRIIHAANQARDELLFHSGMRTQVARSIARLQSEVRGITLIAGYPEYEGKLIFNSAIVIHDGAVLR